MARGASRVREGLVGYGHELPGIRAIIQRELYHTPRVPVPHLAVRLRCRAVAVEGRAAGAHHELAYPERRVGDGSRRLRCEALVAVPVTVHYNVRAIPVEGVPQRLIPWVAGDDGPGDKSGLVPIRESAPRRMGGEIGAQPPHLRGARRYVELAVERDDVPGAQVVAVVAQAGRARQGSEVVEVAAGARRFVVVVAGDRAG